MLRNFISTLTEGRYGKTVHEFEPVALSLSDKSKMSFIVKEKAGERHLVLELLVDEGHEIEREYCNVDLECVEGIERLIADVKKYVSQS